MIAELVVLTWFVAEVQWPDCLLTSIFFDVIPHEGACWSILYKNSALYNVGPDAGLPEGWQPCSAQMRNSPHCRPDLDSNSQIGPFVPKFRCNMNQIVDLKALVRNTQERLGKVGGCSFYLTWRIKRHYSVMAIK